MTKVLKRIGFYAFGVLVLLWSLFPLYWGLFVSFTTRSGIQKTSFRPYPSPFTVGNYEKLLSMATQESSDFYQALVNSIIQAGGATIVTAIVSLAAGYAFARWRSAGLGLGFAMILGTIGVPLLAVLLPLYKAAAKWGLMDTHIPMIVLGMTTTLAISTWVMRSFAATLPSDIEAAARIDGAGTGRVILSIILPLLRPALTAVSIIVFLTTWGLFLPPLMFSQSMDTQPLVVLIPNFVTKASADLGLQSAAGILAILPPMVLVIALHRYLLGGLLRGAVK